jgi:hypothetical protein
MKAKIRTDLWKNRNLIVIFVLLPACLMMLWITRGFEVKIANKTSDPINNIVIKLDGYEPGDEAKISDIGPNSEKAVFLDKVFVSKIRIHFTEKDGQRYDAGIDYTVNPNIQNYFFISLARDGILTCLTPWVSEDFKRKSQKVKIPKTDW